MFFPKLSKHKKVSQEEGEDPFWDDDDDFDRANTAPARPLTDIEEFRRSNEFLILEKAAMISQ